MPDARDFAADFKLSVTQALRSQLVSTLESLSWAPLSRDNLDQLERRGGVYQLALDQAPVYVGKADLSLPDRLGHHLRKLSGRLAQDGSDQVLGRVTFRCSYVDEDLDAVAPEKMLMTALGARDEAPWNTMGFGNNDPGRNRDRTLVKTGHFDRLFPIDLSYMVRLSTTDPMTLLSVMTGVKGSLPYVYRFDKNAVPDVIVATEDLPSNGLGTAGAWFAAFAALLPAGWVHVCLPGYVIAYPAMDETEFGSRSAAWRSTGGSSAYVTHEPDFEAGPLEG